MRAWLETPIVDGVRPIVYAELFNGSPAFRRSAADSKLANCFTCGECSSTCPVAGERSVFDPRYLFRAINLGLQEELLHSPSIWLCIGCGRCTEACSQLVDGRAMIAELQKLALETGAVDADLHWRLARANKLIFSRLLDSIDELLGLTNKLRDLTVAGDCIGQLTSSRLVGAGGKTTAMFQVARQLKPPVIVTATTHLARQQTALADRWIVASTPSELPANSETIAEVLLVTGPLDSTDRTIGVDWKSWTDYS